ncbi:hypothetical protein V6N13_108084 [Hibiscus sabdariffa]
MLWGKNSLVRVSQAGSNLYVFSFANNTIRDWVLEYGPWHIKHKSLILRKWEPNLKKLDFDLERMPIWVQFFNVLLELYSKLGISYIASVIGLPLYMDSVTASKERLEFAKACIEIGMDAIIPEQVRVVLRDKSVVNVKVVVPWLPPCCQSCRTFGHSTKYRCARIVGDREPTTVGDGFVVSDGSGATIEGYANIGANMSSIVVDVGAKVGDDVMVPAGIGDHGVGSADVRSEHLQVVDIEFPTLQASIQKKKGRGRPTKDGKKLIGSSHVVDSLQSIEADGDKKKIKNIVQDLKLKKKRVGR